MRVFADLHHADLYHSLHLLFEERFGWELYHPIGFDWFHAGYWKIAEPYGNAMDTVGQFLDPANCSQDIEEAWPPGFEFNMEGGLYRTFEPIHQYERKGIAFDQFKSIKFDVIVSSFDRHDRPYEQLRNEFQPNAVVVAQMGNVNQRTHLPFVMHTTPFAPSSNQTTVMYHQEIDPNIYKYILPNPSTKNIYSMVNLLPRPEIYNSFKARLPEVNFRAYGASCPDGALHGCAGVAEKMQESNIGWHIKPQDGFGHTAMGWFHSGRPVVTTMSDVVSYGADAPRLFEPDVTCINVESANPDEICCKINQWLEPEVNLRLAENARKRFMEVVNYDEEEQALRAFFAKILQ